MSALPQSILPTPDLSNFVAIDEAAVLLGIHVNSVARKCREEWRGWAMQAVPPDGGQVKTFINRDADRQLSVNVQERPGNLRAYSEDQVRDARARMACVEEFIRAEKERWRGQAVNVWEPLLIDELRGKFTDIRIGRTQLREWRRRYKPGDPEPLIDRRGGKRGEGEQAARKLMKQIYLTDQRLSAAHCRDLAIKIAVENGWEFKTSLRTCQVWMKEIAEETRLLAREPDRWSKQMQPTIAQDPEAWGANERWVLDDKTLDVICTFQNGKRGRPVLTSVMDWRTRKVLSAVVVENGNRASIIAALRIALLDPNGMGRPDEVVADNGKHYASQDIVGQTKAQRRRALLDRAIDETDAVGMSQMLGIKWHLCDPYNPNSKSRLERWHRTLERPCRLFATYVSYNTETRPVSLKKMLKNPAAIPTLQQVAAAIADHIAWWNARSEHQIADLVEDGKPISPNDAMARWCKSKGVFVSRAAVNDALRCWSPPVPVGRRGVGLKLEGRVRWYGQFEGALSAFKSLKKSDRDKKLVRVAYDPENLNTVSIYTAQKLKWVCDVKMNRLGGGSDPVSLKMVQELKREKARYKRSAQDHDGNRLRRRDIVPRLEQRSDDDRVLTRILADLH